MIYLQDVLYNGKPLLKQAITRGMKADMIICIIAGYLTEIDKALKMGMVNYTAIGLKKCDVEGGEYADIVATIMNKMITKIGALENLAGGLNKTFTDMVNKTGATDQYVKINASDTTGGFLQDKLKSSQPGTLAASTDGKSLIMTGFIPVGGVIGMDASGASKFDNTGLGKSDSDCWCFAVCNGANGTKNKMGKFPRWATAISGVGAPTSGGSSNFSIAAANIESLDFAISGDIDPALSASTPVSAQVGSATVGSGTGVLGGFDSSVEVVTLDPSGGRARQLDMTLNLSHTHTHKLTGKYVNTLVKKIDLLPVFYDEIPIQRIK